jgi:hypothetical protein
MSGSDELAAIEARLTADENEYDGSVIDQNARDRRYLLDLAREQAARLAAVTVLADYLETLADGENHYASLIRGALGTPRA